MMAVRMSEGYAAPMKTQRGRCKDGSVMADLVEEREILIGESEGRSGIVMIVRPMRRE